MGITRDVAQYIAGTKFEDLPQNVVRLTKQLVLDEIGCAMGALSVDQARILVEYAKDIGSKPEATIVGQSNRVPCFSAAGANAFLAFTLDYDETYRNYSHPASHGVFTALALGEREGASGKDIITSIVTAYEVVTRILDATRPSPELMKRYENHSYLAFGAMVAAAKILGLDEAGLCEAIGITAYTAPLVNLQIWIKPPGGSSIIKFAGFWQCQAGVEAAELAQRGFMGPPDVLDEKEAGYWAGVSDRCKWDILTDKLGEEYYLEKYLAFKPWSCCRWHQPGIEMLLKLLEEEKIDPMDIDEIVYGMHSNLVSYAPFHKTLPKNEFESMFSVAWSLATMALGYQPGPDWFAEERLNDPRVRELVKKVRLEEDAEITQLKEAHPEMTCAKLELKAKGKVYQSRVDYTKGDPQKPMTQEEIEGKFRNMARRVVGDKNTERIIDIVNHLEELDNVKELTEEFVAAYIKVG